MESLLLVIIGILAVILFALLAKVHSLRRGAREIAEAFRDRMAADTNTLIDISSRDRYLRQLASQINLQLRQLRREQLRCQLGDRELKEAVTNISHDLRTPLTAICGCLDLLEREEKSTAVEGYLTQIRSRAEAMETLTEELFRYSIIASVQELKPEKIDLKRILEESLLAHYALMQEKNIQPRISLPEDALWRRLDAGALSRIFSNLISNALKYSDGDFSVSLDTAGRVCFSNHARGLDPVAVGRLFDRFYTVESSRRSTGLGLAIARTLTEQMGGAISACLDSGILTLYVSFPETP